MSRSEVHGGEDATSSSHQNGGPGIARYAPMYARKARLLSRSDSIIFLPIVYYHAATIYSINIPTHMQLSEIRKRLNLGDPTVPMAIIHDNKYYYMHS